MSHPHITEPVFLGVDWKGLGYLVDPRWHLPVLLAGMVASILGMALRYKAHLDQQRELKKAEAEAKAKR
jgi:hypothetical protein